ncbi:MAG TPA: hypothetical protein PL143_14200 [Rhodocyclaceae bacterium]|nr:hypothetical protein [Rhodocyclaceae bacterium]
MTHAGRTADYPGHTRGGDERLQRVYASTAGTGTAAHTAAPIRRVTTGTAAGLLSMHRSTLRVAAFWLRAWGQIYVNPTALDIDLGRLAPALFRVVVIHDFQHEDCNPVLDECRAAVFLARRVDVRWEEAESHPLECRTIALLGYVDNAARTILPP